MMRFLPAALVAIGLSACAPQGTIQVEAPVISAHGEVAAGYFTMRNGGPDDALISVSSPAASAVEMHVSEMKDNMMSMRRLDRVAAPPGVPIAFEPGGMHLMVFGLKPVKDGDSVPMTFTFEKAGAKVELK